MSCLPTDEFASCAAAQPNCSGWNGPPARCGGRPARRPARACAGNGSIDSSAHCAEARRRVAAENGQVGRSTLHPSRALAWCAALLFAFTTTALGQSVILPTPRLLTTMPMGGQVGTTVEVTLTGEVLEDVTELLFSTPKISAKAKAGAANIFLVTIAPDAPLGVHDARFVGRLGVSSARAFSVGKLPEVTRTRTNTSLETALELKPNSVCNAAMTALAAEAKKLADAVNTAPAEKRAEAELAAKTAAEKLKAAETAKTAATGRMKSATATAAPTDIADIVVSEPIRVRVLPVEKK